MNGIVQRLERGRAAFLWACGLDVAVRKPGNVSRASAGHGMQADAFLASAEAAAGPLFARGQPVGARIEAAVAATRAAAGCNTNLGILLLCAPLAVALERLADDSAPGKPLPGHAAMADGGYEPVRAPMPEGGALGPGGPERGVDAAALHAAVHAVLADLDMDDARAAYRAIALANPGGLGRVPAEDVAAPPGVDLRAAMALAAGRDSIARQYAQGYADVFGCGFAELRLGHGGTARLATVVQRVFLRFLAGWPDSHIVRKLGCAAAQTVTGDAAAWLARFDADPAAGDGAAFVEWDEALKAAGINPGTSADLTVCTLFAAALVSPKAIGMGASQSWHGLCVHPCGIGLIPTSDTGAAVRIGRPG